MRLSKSEKMAVKCQANQKGDFLFIKSLFDSGNYTLDGVAYIVQVLDKFRRIYKIRRVF